MHQARHLKGNFYNGKELNSPIHTQCLFCANFIAFYPDHLDTHERLLNRSLYIHAISLIPASYYKGAIANSEVKLVTQNGGLFFWRLIFFILRNHFCTF